VTETSFENELRASYEVAQLKARYFRLLDTKDWDGWIENFTPDAVMDMSGEPAAFGATEVSAEDAMVYVYRGRDAIKESVSTSLMKVDSCHHGHVCEFTLVSPTVARGIWSMEDIIRYKDSGGFRGYGHYHDTYVKVDGRWKIAATKIVRLFIMPFE
jgi:SnoaL-like domain